MTDAERSTTSSSDEELNRFTDKFTYSIWIFSAMAQRSARHNY